MKNKIKTLIVLFTIFISNTTYSQVLITNPFTGTFNWLTNGNVNSFVYNGAIIEDVSVGNFNKINVTTSSSSGNFRATSWTTNATPDLSKYFEFSLTAATGTKINMGNISFGIGRSSTGPLKWQWRSSIDNFATVATNYVSVNTNTILTDGTISVPDLNSNWLGNVISFSNTTGFENITFRFYGFGAETNSGTGGFQGNLTFIGESVSVIPEPSVVSLLMICGIFAVVCRMKSRLS